jgi:hypothetical protein
VTVLRDGSVFAVGRRFGVVTGVLEFRTYAMRRVGTQWVTSYPDDREGPPATNFLNGVAGTSAEDVWAVGWSRHPRGTPTFLIEHFDGTDWSIVPTPVFGLGDYLEDVAVYRRNSAWAVGSAYNPAEFRQVPVALRWDGVRWTGSLIPRDPECTGGSSFTDVSYAPFAEIAYAVGYCQGQDRSFVMRWQNGQWRLLPLRLPQPSQLHGVHVRRWNDVWIVGWTRKEGRDLNLAYHFDGVRWTQFDVPATGHSQLSSVVASAPDRAWAVGIGDSPQPPFAGPKAFMFDGTEWTEVAPGDFGNFASVAGDRPRASVIAVGQRVGRPLVAIHRR